MTDIDWVKPIELDTNSPRPAEIAFGPNSNGNYSVKADWRDKGNEYAFTLWVNSSGRVLGIISYPMVRNVAPATDPCDELAAIAKAEGRS